jgi:type II secretory pathway pseudopilin PulG
VRLILVIALVLVVAGTWLVVQWVRADQREKRKATRRQVAATDAQTEIERARGEAEAIRITNEAISSQGAAYLQLKWIEKWDGKLPVYSLGGGSSFIFDLGALPGTATPTG